jgi:hypothetical protein
MKKGGREGERTREDRNSIMTIMLQRQHWDRKLTFLFNKRREEEEKSEWLKNHEMIFVTKELEICEQCRQRWCKFNQHDFIRRFWVGAEKEFIVEENERWWWWVSEWVSEWSEREDEEGKYQVIKIEAFNYFPSLITSIILLLAIYSLVIFLLFHSFFNSWRGELFC